MEFDFGCARGLYAAGVHPRVLLGPDDVGRLRRVVRAGDGRAIMDAIRWKARPLVARALATGDVGAALADRTPPGAVFRSALLSGVGDLGLVALLDRCPDAMETVRRVLCGLSRLPVDATSAPGYVYQMISGGHPLAYDLIRDQLAPGEARDYASWVASSVSCVVQAARSDVYFKNAGANTPIGMTLPAIVGALAVVGDAGAPTVPESLRQLMAFLEASLYCAIGADGYPEEDTGYGTAVAGCLGQLAELARRAGLLDPYACPNYARFGEAILHFVQPWGEHLTNTGDHSDAFGWREMILARQAAERRQPALLWLLGTLKYGRPPRQQGGVEFPVNVEAPLRKGIHVPATAMALVFADQYRRAVPLAKTDLPTAFRDRTRGIVSLRSGWRPHDTFVVFDGSQRSPAGQGHMHASAGHFSLSALGEYFAIDTGRYNTEQSCHNVSLIDGKSGRSTNGEWGMTLWHGNLTGFEPDGFCDWAAVDSSLQHNCYWARRCLGLVKGPGAPAYVWVVDDLNKANDWAEYWWQLHTSPENVIRLRDAGATITGWRHGNMLDVHFATPAAGTYPKDHTLVVSQDVAEGSSYRYIANPQERAAQYARPSDMLHYSVFQRPRLLARVAGYNGRFMSLMLPRLKGERPARVTRLESVPNSLAVRIAYGQVEDTLVFAYEHHLLEAGDVRGRGAWCVVRRDHRTGRVLAHALGDGSSLRAGKRVLR